MQNNNTLLMLGAIVAAAVVAVGAYLLFAEQPAAAPDDPMGGEVGETADDAVEEPEEADTASGGTIEGGERTDAADAAQSAPEEDEDELQPSIVTTPYSVYIGFATKHGTSSPEVLRQEVGEAVVGYEWEALFPSPLFATVSLPRWSNVPKTAIQPEYTVRVWDEDEEAYTLLGKYPSRQEIEFPREGFLGVRKFRVTGIDPALHICPGDRSFNWEARFTLEGDLGLIRTPLTEKLPEGETCQMR